MPHDEAGGKTPETVGVAGLGVSGIAAATLLRGQGYRVVGFDQATRERADFPQLDQVISNADPEALAQKIVDQRPRFLVVSPGIPESSPLVTEPKAAGVEVIGEVQLAWNLSVGKGQPNWLCVTGTNGKTTTVGMLASILEAAGLQAAAVGNVGYPITEAAFQGLEAMAVELSSFQLATSQNLHPAASICLNIDSDHLDWHGSRDAYIDAKAAVYNGTRIARFYFADEPETQKMAENASDAQGSLLVPLTFAEVPEGSIGLVGGVVVDKSGLPHLEFDQVASERAATSTKIAIANFAEIPLLAGAIQEDVGVSDPLVRDALAAVALARAQGVAPQAIQQGLTRFRPDAHRREPVGEFEGVHWVNDSKATNVHAAIAAASASPAGHLVWIMGGDAKGQDLRPLAAAAGLLAKAVVVLGASPEALQTLLKEEAPETPLVVICEDEEPRKLMGDAVRACAEFAAAGDTVLLAPGCASWDQFASYAERGSLFREAIKEMYAMKGK